MDFGDPEQYYMIFIGLLAMISLGLAVMGTMVTSEARSATGKGSWPYWVAGITLFVVGWMVLDRIWFPERFAGMSIIQFIKYWFGQKFS